MTLPRKLIHVEYEAALGWPTPERRRVVARNFTSWDTVARQLAAIDRLPSHCRLLGVWETACDWTQVDDTTIARPEDEAEEMDDA